MILSKAWLRFISIVAFTSAVTSGLAALAAYGFGYDTLPPITIGTHVLAISLVVHGWIPAVVYIVSNIFDALTEQVSEVYNTLGKIGSWVALVLFTIAGALVIGQMSLNTENIRRVLDPSGSMFLLAILWIFAVFDVLVLQYKKNQSLARNEGAHVAAHEVAHSDVVHGDVISPTRLDSRVGAPLIGSAPNARIYYFNCEGRDVTVTPSAVDGGEPTVRVSGPTDHAA